MKDWKTWVLGALFTIAMSFAGLVYSNTSDRISTLEQEQQQTVSIRTDALSKLAVTQAQLATAQEQLDIMSMTLVRLEENQEEMKYSQSQLISRVTLLLSTTSKDSRRWNMILDSWEEQFNASKKKK